MANSPKHLDGNAVAEKILKRTAARVQRLRDESKITPALATVLVGEDPASSTYVRMKQRRCRAVGMESIGIQLPDTISTADLVAEIQKLSRDDHVHGILLQHPVPHGIDERAAFEAIAPEKDVDGVTLHNFALTALGGEANTGFDCCTPGGIMRLLAAYNVDLKGRQAVVIGRSPIVGKPMAMMLLAAHATVTICHSRTVDLPQVVSSADLVVAAVGKPRFVHGDWIRPDAIVVDAGYNPGNVGDVDFDTAATRASMITPVPGGVGPMTIATLIEQTATAAARRAGLKTGTTLGEGDAA